MQPTGEEQQIESVTKSISILLPAIQNLYKQNVGKMMQPFGVSGGQSALLIQLCEKDGQLQKELASRLNVKAPSLTTMIDRMQRDGLVERRRNEEDHRATRTFLTAKGMQAARRIRGIVGFLNERSLAGFRTEEKLLLLRFLEHMRENMEKQKDELDDIEKNDMLY